MTTPETPGNTPADGYPELKSDTPESQATFRANVFGPLEAETGPDRRNIPSLDRLDVAPNSPTEAKIAITEALRQATGGDFQQRIKSLQNRGIQFVHDLLVVGKDRVSDARSVGSLLLQNLELAITRSYPGAQWKAQPEIADIVQVCSGLDRVTAEAIGFGTADYFTVQDILIMPWAGLEQVARNFGPDATAGAIRESALAFGKKFRLEQNRQNQNRTP